MFYFLFYSISLLTSTLFTMMKHPLAMGLMLLIQTFLISLLSGNLVETFWFSYVLFLIFLGGMLVLFIYVTSLASNEMFNFSMKIFKNILMAMLLLTLYFLIFDKTLMMNYMKNSETNSLIFNMTFMLENSLMLNKLYNFPINLITIMLMMYLFLTLIAIVKITDISMGALRPNF